MADENDSSFDSEESLHLSCESSDFEESIDTTAKGVQPYQFEPYASGSEGDDNDEVYAAEAADDQASRLHSLNTWCRCTQCVLMPSIKECLCCQEVAPMAQMMQVEGIECITEHPGFNAVCLNVYVLDVAYYWYRQQYGHQILNTNNRYRYTAHRQLTRLVWGFLGKNVRVVLPACSVTLIRKTFPSEDGTYSGYLEPE